MIAPIVIQPLEDAAQRIAPNMVDPGTRTELQQVLTTRRQELLAGRVPSALVPASARIQLAYAYDRVDLASRRLNASGDDALSVRSPWISPISPRFVWLCSPPRQPSA